MTKGKYADCIPLYIKKIIQALLDADYQAYVVGGAVRDLLLGIHPGDFDIATNACPENTLAICQQNGWKTVDKLGGNYGCVVAVVDHIAVEITTFRGEGYGSDAHRPEQIWYCDNLEEDLSRRDFTVNAMAMDIEGNIYDYFNGAQDLTQKILRTVGNSWQRYEEDALRMLRACRFVGQLGFNYVQSDKLLPAFGQQNTPYYLPVNFEFPADRCAGLSLERVKKELDKLLMTEHAGQGLMLLMSTGLTDAFGRIKEQGNCTEIAILPELRHLVGLKQNTRFHCYDVWEHTLQAIDNSPRDLAIRWSLLLHDIGKGLPGIRCLNKEGQPGDHGHEAKSAEMAAEILRRLHYPEKFIKEVVWLVSRHMRFAPMLVTGRKTLLHWVRTEAASGQFRTGSDMTNAFSKLVEVFLADMGATHAKNNPALMEAGRQLGRQVIELAANYPIHTSELAISGREITQICPHHSVGQLLNYLLQRVQSGNLANNKETLLAALHKYLNKH